jgi:hypothetical protein
MLARLRSRWGPLRRAFPLKLSGLFLLAGAAWIFYYYGQVKEDVILKMASLTLIAVAVLLILLVSEAGWATYRWWRRERQTLATELSALMVGQPAQLPLSRRPPWRPLVEINWRWLQPEPVEVRWSSEGGQAFEEFTFPRRCQVYQVEREFEISDVLGFACVRFRSRQPLRCDVLPVPQPLNRSAFVTSFCHGEDVADLRGEPVGDRVDMRQYAAGDPPKLLLWKLYARTGKLMVRQSERAVSPTPRTCAYLVAGPQDEVAAGLMRSILESGLLGHGWRFGADGSQGHCTQVDEALTFLARSGNPKVKCDLGAFLEQAHRDGFSGCLVALPSQPGAWMKELRQAVPGRALKISLAAAPGFFRANKLPPAWHKWVFSTPPLEAVGEPEQVLRDLADVSHERWLYHPSQHGFVRFGGR